MRSKRCAVQNQGITLRDPLNCSLDFPFKLPDQDSVALIWFTNVSPPFKRIISKSLHLVHQVRQVDQHISIACLTKITGLLL